MSFVSKAIAALFGQSKHHPEDVTPAVPAEANTPSPWGGPPRVKFDSTNTIVITDKSKKEMPDLTPAQTQAIKIDDLRDTIKTNTQISKIFRHNYTKPKRIIMKRCRKLVDLAQECYEKDNHGKFIKFKEGKYDQHVRLMTEAKKLAKTLRSRQTRPFNSVLHHERTVILRAEQRASLIAYGYLNGKSYAEIEDNPRWKRFLRHKCGHGVQPNWNRVRSIIIEYSVFDKEKSYNIREEVMQKVELWKGN